MSKIPTRNIDPICPRSKNPRQPHLSYCRECRNELKRDARRRKAEGLPALKTGRKVEPNCPRCPKDNPKPKRISETGKVGSYCDECNRAVNREHKKRFKKRKGNAVRQPSKYARPQNNHGAGAEVVLEKKRPPGNPDLCGRFLIAQIPPDAARRARLERIARDGPKYSDTEEDIAASGWVPLTMEENVRARYR